MTRCANCNVEWDKKTKMKRLTAIDRGVKCPKCGEYQYISKKSSRQNSIALILTLAIVIMTPVFLDINIFFLAGMWIVFVVVNLLLPYFNMTLVNKDELLI